MAEWTWLFLLSQVHHQPLSKGKQEINSNFKKEMGQNCSSYQDYLKHGFTGPLLNHSLKANFPMYIYSYRVCLDSKFFFWWQCQMEKLGECWIGGGRCGYCSSLFCLLQRLCSLPVSVQLVTGSLPLCPPEHSSKQQHLPPAPEGWAVMKRTAHVSCCSVPAEKDLSPWWGALVHIPGSKGTRRSCKHWI